MSIQPTFQGYVATIHDALLLFQATINGILMPVSRRPHDRERAGVIKSGAVFIFSEQAAGIKRWTDGISWSPSRILGNFLVYRQLEKPFGPGEKKRAAKRAKLEESPPKNYSNRYNPYGSSQYSSSYYQGDQAGPSPSSERSLVGSLVDSYGFKENGLIKKTISIVVSGIHHHMVSYYKPEDVLQGKFITPSEAEGIRDIPVSEELIKRQNFRIPPDSQQGQYTGAAVPSTAVSAPVSAPSQAPYYSQSYYSQPFATQMPPPIGRGYATQHASPHTTQHTQHPTHAQAGAYTQAYPTEYDSQTDRGYVSGYRPFSGSLPGITSGAGGAAASGVSGLRTNGSSNSTSGSASASVNSGATASGSPNTDHYYYNQHDHSGSTHSPSLPPLADYSSTPSNYSAMDPRKLPEANPSTPSGAQNQTASAPNSGPLASRTYNSSYNPSW